MRILAIDIETTPNLAHVWSLWNQNVGLNQLIESTEMMCFAAKWLGEKPIQFYSTKTDGKLAMVLEAWRLLDEADVVMHYNGRRFDVPHINREFLEADLKPPSPFQQIDLYQVVKRRFKLPSNKLDYVAKLLGLGGKVHHEGHELWVKCMAGDRDAWRTMAKYNKQDVLLLEELYKVLQPWIPAHPSWAAFTARKVCVKCGKARLKKDGLARLRSGTYQQYRCAGCGGWSRDTKRLSAAPVVEVTG